MTLMSFLGSVLCIDQAKIEEMRIVLLGAPGSGKGTQAKFHYILHDSILWITTKIIIIGPGGGVCITSGSDGTNYASKRDNDKQG